MASQITSISIVSSAVCSGTLKEYAKVPALLAFVRGTSDDWWILLTQDQ